MCSSLHLRINQFSAYIYYALWERGNLLNENTGDILLRQLKHKKYIQR